MTNESPLTIAFGADHAGYKLKDALVTWARAQGHNVLDFGTEGPASVDYPDYAHLVCPKVLSGEANYGVLVCGTGLGMSMSANRFHGIRCAMLSETTSARLPASTTTPT